MLFLKKFISKEYLNKLLVLLIVLGPILNGYYIESTKLTMILVAIVILGLLLLEKLIYQRVIKLDLLGYILIIFGMINLAGIFNAVELRASLIEVILVIIYILTFLHFRNCDYTQVTSLLNLLFFSSALISLLGIAEYSGLIKIAGFRYGLRLQSTFQYANTTAIFFLFTFLYGIYNELFLSKNNSRYKNIFFVLSSLIYFAFLLTFSRGVLIIGFLIVLLLLTIIDKRKELLFEISLIIGPSLLSVPLFIKLINNHKTFYAWLIFAAAIFLSYLIKNLSKRNFDQFKTLKYFKLCSVILLVVGLIITINYNPILLRVKTINLSNASLHERFDMYKDAIRIIKDYPLVGTGAGGWEQLYQSYQTNPYTSNEVHSNLFNIGISNGLIGLITYIVFWLILFKLIYKTLKQNMKTLRNDFKLNLLLFLVIGILIIFTHSLIDFDLSFPAISLIFWALAGSSVQLAEKINEGNSTQTKLTNSIFLRKKYFILILILLIPVGYIGTLLTGSYYGKEGVKYLNLSSYDESIEYLNKAVKLDSYNSQYYLALARAHELRNPEEKSTIEFYYKKSHSLNPNSWENNKDYGLYLLGNSQISLGVSYLDKAYRYHPLNYQHFPEIVSGYLQAIDLSFKLGNTNYAIQQYDKIIRIYRNDKLPNSVITPEISLILGQGYYFNKDFNKSLKYLHSAAKSTIIHDKTLLWRALVYDKLKNKGQVDKLLDEMATRDKDLLDRFYYIREIKL